MKRTPLGFFILSIMVLVLGTVTAFGQASTSRLNGVVTDSNGGIIAGATVTLTNEGNNISLTTASTSSGQYVFESVQAGTYTVTVEQQGFKKSVSTGNPVNLSQPAVVNISLEPGAVAETVTVVASAEQVQTGSSGNLGSTIEQKTLESLPIVGTRGRNPLDLLNFQPGVVFGGNTGGAVNVNGSRDRAFNFTLDGIDINESTAGGSNFTPLRPNPDSVQEFQIVTSNFTAELGRSSGAQVTLVTRSGTNDFHGNVFEYYRTPRLDAKSYPVTIAGTAKEQFVQHIFGGSLGGPLFNPGFGKGGAGWLRDKAFFFTNLQLLRAYDTALVTRTVYTQSARQGIFRYILQGQNAPVGAASPLVASVDANGNSLFAPCPNPLPAPLPSTLRCVQTYNVATNPSGIGIDPTIAAIINASPLPNNFTTGDGLNTAGFNFASPQHEKQYDFVSKFDFKLSDNGQIYVRYAQGSQSSLGDSANGGRPIFPGAPNFVDTSRTPKNLAINWRWSPTGTVTNEFIFGVSKYFFTFATPHPDANLPFTFLNMATPNTNFTYNARGVRTLQFIDNLSFVRGPNTFRGGINFRFNRHRDDRSGVAGSAIEPVIALGGNGGYGPFLLPSSGATSINTNDLTRLQNTINDELGRINTVSQAFVSDPDNPNAYAPAGTRWLNEANYPELDFYFQDTWRAKSNLIFDMGLRLEAKLHPTVNGRGILVPNQAVKLGAAPSNTIRWVEGDVFQSAKVWLPSFGFAWDPFKNGKTSIRGNYRIASDRIATFLFGSSIFQSAPGNTAGASNSAFGQAGGLFRNVQPIIAALAPSRSPDALRQPDPFGTGSISVVDPDLQFPQVHEWSFSFQREVKHTVIEVNYIGKHAAHLLGGYNVNQVNVFAGVPGVSENFLQAFNRIRDDIRVNGTTITYNSPLMNLLFTGNAANNAGTATFRSAASTNTISLGNAATAALVVSQRLCASADVTAGICTATGGQLLARTIGNPFLFQPYPQFSGGLNVFDSSDYSNYGGLQFILKRRIYSGLGLQFGYTYSKSKDNRSWDPSLSTVSTGSVQSASSTPFDLRDRHLNYAWSDFDRRHVFQGTYTYELPFGRGKEFLSGPSKIVNHLVGGWLFSGTVIWQSGRPFTVYSGLNTISNVVQSTADCSSCTRDIGNLVQEGTPGARNFWFDAATRALFSAPAPGTIGTTGRNFFIAPVYFQWDASLSKKISISERVKFDLRLDARNVLNHPSFDNPTAVITSSLFGRINDTVTNNARRIQVSGKLSF